MVAPPRHDAAKGEADKEESISELRAVGYMLIFLLLMGGIFYSIMQGNLDAVNRCEAALGEIVAYSKYGSSVCVTPEEKAARLAKEQRLQELRELQQRFAADVAGAKQKAGQAREEAARQRAVTEAARHEARRQRALADEARLEAEKETISARAQRRILEEELDKRERQNLWENIAISGVFALLGVVLGILVDRRRQRRSAAGR